MLSASGPGSRSSRHPWNVLVIVAALAAWSFASPARAQTAHFSGAITTLGGGFVTAAGVAVDASGNVYVADESNVVEQIPPGCTSSSCVKALGGGLSASTPTGVAIDAHGDVYVAGLYAGFIYEIPANCIAGANNASCVTTLGGGFDGPVAVAVDGNGNVYVADAHNSAVKEIPASCIAGANNAGCVLTLGGGFNVPQGVAVDGTGNVYVADSLNNAVKEIPASCIAGANNAGCVLTLGGGFNAPIGVAVDGTGNVYVADPGNNAVKEIPSGCASSSCVTALGAGFEEPTGVAVDAQGNVYVADPNNDDVKEIELRSVDFSSVPVGTTSAAQTLTFTFDAAATLGAPTALTLGAPNLDFAIVNGGACASGASFNAGDTCTVNATFTPKYAGTRNGAVELTDSTGAVIATAYVHGTGSGPQAAFDPGAMTTLGGGFSGPYEVAVDGSGNVYVADIANNAVEEIPFGCASSSCVEMLGGGFSDPHGVAVDGHGNVYVADYLNDAVKEIPPGCTSSSCVTTLGGGFNVPSGVAVDGSGNVYVADTLNHAVKEMTPNCASSSCEKTLGGGFDEPIGVAVDGNGNVFVTDSNNPWVKEIPSGCASSSCVVMLGSGFSNGGVTVDGSGNVYFADWGNNGVKEIPAGCASSSCEKTLGGGFNEPTGVAVDGGGNVYVADWGNKAVKEIQRATPPALSFASTAVGSTSSPQTVTVENIGNQPLTFPIPTVAGSYNPSMPAGFKYNDSSTCLQTGASAGTAFTLAPAASCTVVIDFAPVAAGPISGDAVLTDDSLNAAAPNYATQQIPLSGTAIQSTTQLGFSTSPAAAITAGGNAGTITVAEQDSTGATVTTGADSITLTVTGPNSYSKTYTATASSGIASFDLSSAALTAAGSYTYKATSGSYTEATATESVSAASAASISAVSGSGQSADIGTAFADTLVVKVEDSYGNPVAGATVVYTAPSSGASATLTTPTATADDGETEVTATANNTVSAAAYSVSAAVAGVSTPATFSLTNTQAAANLTFSLSLTGGQNQTVAPGSAATYTFQISPTFGTYPGDVSFSVSGLPQGATASFSPPTIAANGGAQTVTMTIHTSATTARNHAGSLFQHGAPLALGFLLLPLFGVRKRKRWMRMLTVALLLVGAGAFTGLASGCGSANGFFGQQQKSYSVTVTATGGAVSEATVVTLNVE